MADRYPLIFNTSASQIQELSANDNLNMLSSSLLSVSHVNCVGVVTATDFNTTSDFNLKKNIQKVNESIDKILKIDGVEFEWKSDNKPSIGVIAQNVEEVFPELVTQNDDIKKVNYNGLIGVLIEVVKEQNKKIEDLSMRIENLESRKY